jgi:CRP/FNR family transcriptional regulator
MDAMIMPGSGGKQPLPEEWPEQFHFLHQATVHTLFMPRGSAVFTEGQGCGRLGFVFSGQIRVFKNSETGREMTLYRIGAGESCILSMSCALSYPIHQASAIVEEDAWVLTLTPQDFHNLMNTSAEARDYVFNQFADRLTNTLMLIEEIVFRRMDTRLAQYIVKHSAPPAKPDIQCTHEGLATELGTAREVISRLLKEFEQQELVELSRGNIKVLNRKGLQKAYSFK